MARLYRQRARDRSRRCQPPIAGPHRASLGLEATQQESIDQLQVVQDQLQTVRRLLASQQADTRKLSEQVGSLTEAIEGLRQSFASTQASEPAAAPTTRKRSVRARYHAIKSANRKRSKSNS
jgi:hypothetical protein